MNKNKPNNGNSFPWLQWTSWELKVKKIKKDTSWLIRNRLLSKQKKNEQYSQERKIHVTCSYAIAKKVEENTSVYKNYLCLNRDEFRIMVVKNRFFYKILKTTLATQMLGNISDFISDECHNLDPVWLLMMTREQSIIDNLKDFTTLKIIDILTCYFRINNKQLAQFAWNDKFKNLSHKKHQKI